VHDVQMMKHLLDTPETDIDRWLQGLDILYKLNPQPRFVIPGHGMPSEDLLRKRVFIFPLRRQCPIAMHPAVPFFHYRRNGSGYSRPAQPVKTSC
jgi:hypothetical protein